MIARLLVLVVGLAGATGASQFPEFSQQYAQRLAGAVDELQVVVEDFDRDAGKLDLSREAALTQMEGEGAMAAARASSMRRVFDRHDKLSADLAVLRGVGPVERARHAWRMTDGDVAAKAWEDFRPAVPATVEGLGFAAGGFVLGWALVAVVLGLGRRLFFRRRREAA
jgi:hypothetical protein